MPGEAKLQHPPPAGEEGGVHDPPLPPRLSRSTISPRRAPFTAGRSAAREGRSSDAWIDFDLYGHQIVAHLDPAAKPVAVSNPVDGHDVPVPHFGVVLTMPDWQALADRLTAAGTHFGIAPHMRFVGQPGEQATMFFYDPSGNALEFKAFADDAMTVRDMRKPMR